MTWCVLVAGSAWASGVRWWIRTPGGEGRFWREDEMPPRHRSADAGGGRAPIRKGRSPLASSVCCTPSHSYPFVFPIPVLSQADIKMKVFTLSELLTSLYARFSN
ncbi:hypothetical protein CALVIDRAFT_247515 [Calocera viscosa TUFC12733]|uniref:Secreted protein n=1 Tax=Calocera viscosa (strain TUFC12733) TaxID=1330018 RepID=A0A167JKV9_CALVF|nr:hypothetical protein CALVIDRAFT_247515 [Calocera viscosa TUFC12733]